jgi:hypothetical protein
MKDGYKLLVLFDPHIQTNPAPGTTKGWKPATSRALTTAMEFGEFWKPDETIVGHDFMEFGPISYWNQRRRLDMEGRRLAHDFEYANQILDCICGFTTTKIIFQPGNHDAWMSDYIQENPSLEGLINTGKMLGFKSRNIQELKYGLPYRVGKAAFSHSLLNNRKTFNTKYHSSRIAEDYGRSIFYGHFHTHQVYTRVTYDSKPNTAVGIGCLGNLNPGWLRNSPNAWVNQLLFMEFDKQGHFTFYCPILINGKFSYGGKVFGNVTKGRSA